MWTLGEREAQDKVRVSLERAHCSSRGVTIVPVGCDVIFFEFLHRLPRFVWWRVKLGSSRRGGLSCSQQRVSLAREEHMRLGVGKLMCYRVGMDSARRNEEVVFTDSSRSEGRFAGLADSRYLVEEFSCASLRGWHRPPWDQEGLRLECSSLVWMLGWR